ncbi:MAG: AGE family epimerase/isomerase [Thermoflavifilum sp.]|uniref:AGE family epimerase/isomerase n=1 Tax=Thermoflavifilum sp. TaxID=1968839 RepID=UPI0018A51E83|nr:AGE family epimerase/isomerase [Thermoflavifilum sp.]QOR76058.1 MAG: AGE family epimerase/isomerase [Thermoflavifilum sp.]
MPINPLNALTNRWRKACLDILHWWMTYAIDRAGPGFYGEVNNLNLPGFFAPKGLVMHARILWSFATAYAYFREEALIETAYLAEQILEQYFHDTRHEGYYWKLHADYQIADSRKMLYGQVFVLYAYVALFQATHHLAG